MVRLEKDVILQLANQKIHWRAVTLCLRCQGANCQCQNQLPPGILGLHTFEATASSAGLLDTCSGQRSTVQSVLERNVTHRTDQLLVLVSSLSSSTCGEGFAYFKVGDCSHEPASCRP